jgi:transcriptional regulator with XRE-family HTH domain
MSKFSELIKKAREHDSYWEESAKHEFAMQLGQLIDAAGLSQKDFASRAGVSESQVSQILAGAKNLSLKTMLKYALVLDCVVRVELISRKSASTPKKSGEPRLITKQLDRNEWQEFLLPVQQTLQPKSSFWELVRRPEESHSAFRQGNHPRIAEAA